LKQPAGILNHSAWGLKIAGIFFIRLVLEAWSLVLDAWHLPAGVLGAWRLELEAWRLKLGASFSPRGARHNILGDTRSLVLAV